MHGVARLPLVGGLVDSWFGRSPRSFFDYAQSGPLWGYQCASEIAALLTLMTAAPPRSVLEIGTANGGTTNLLARFSSPSAVIVTCDVSPRASGEQLQRRARRHQHVEALTLDSHSPEGRDELLGRFPDGVDLLFIDGDHSYEGARGDLLTYGPLARSGALIVFHDIVDDFRTRYGIATPAWVGGVPRLWRELRDDLPEGFRVHEFVDDVRQDGFGIGVLACPLSTRPGDLLVEQVQRRGSI